LSFESGGGFGCGFGFGFCRFFGLGLELFFRLSYSCGIKLDLFLRLCFCRRDSIGSFGLESGLFFGFDLELFFGLLYSRDSLGRICLDSGLFLRFSIEPLFNPGPFLSFLSSCFLSFEPGGCFGFGLCLGFCNFLRLGLNIPPGLRQGPSFSFQFFLRLSFCRKI